MTKSEFFEYCRTCHDVTPDYPFGDDSDSAVLRHPENRKWYALVMRVPRRKFVPSADGCVDVVNLKLPPEISASFGTSDGVYPAYHMNKTHWVSVLLSDASNDLLHFLANVSFDITSGKSKSRDCDNNIGDGQALSS